MSLEEINTYRLPTPPESAPEGHRMDGKGRLVPERAIKAQEQLEDEMVRKVMGHAAALANQVRRFRAHTLADISDFLDLLRQQYGVTPRGARGKGNMTFLSFDGLMKVQVQIADQLVFGPELRIAQEAFAACIAEWAEGAKSELRAIVDQAFEADKEGNINRESVFRLLRLDFDHPKWKAGQDAIRDSIRVVGSKSYFRFYIRENHEAAWQAVPIDLASS
ncbi:MAG: DUF3164 family protein [Oceanibaculum sp.]